MPLAEALKPKLHAARTRVFVQADSSGNVPSRIEVMRAGMWPDTSNKGMLYITPVDLAEMAANFKAGIGVPGGAEFGQLPIDFSHEEWKRAAGWIKDLIVEGDILFAEVEWSKAGLEALAGGEFKCFSPSFYPGCLGEWCDPEDWSITAKNVLVGGALTNIPFFKDLTPIMASRDSQEGHRGNTLFVEAADAKGAPMLVLDEVRVKAAADLIPEEKTFLEQNKAQLSADERKKFDLEDAPAPVVVADQTTDTDKQVLADIRSGKKVLVEASEHQALKASVTDLTSKVEAATKQLEDMNAEKVKASVLEHVKAGRIKADQADKWTQRVLADATMLEDLANMPANPVLADEQGVDGGPNAGVTASDEVQAKAKELIKAAKDEGRTLSDGDAYSQVLRADKDLAARYKLQTEGKE